MSQQIVDSVESLRYALDWQVLGMARHGFTIQTNYGDIAVPAEAAGAFVAVTECFLQRALVQAQKIQESH